MLSGLTDTIIFRDYFNILNVSSKNFKRVEIWGKIGSLVGEKIYLNNIVPNRIITIKDSDINKTFLNYFDYKSNLDYQIFIDIELENDDLQQFILERII